VRIARITHEGTTWLARIDAAGTTATPIATAPPGGGRDALRDLLHAGTDVAGAPAVSGPITMSEATLESPVTAPSKIVAIGLNYADHARESGVEPPKAPVAFVKTPNSIVGPGQDIRYAKDDTAEVDYEAELAVVIGRRASRVSQDEALDYVFGYTCCNDVSARDAQFADGQWVRGKSFDTFCPLGPWIVTADEIADPQALHIACRVNGQTLQDSTTGEMIFGVAEIISYMSRFITFEPGDVIATGTPFGVGFARTPPVYLLNGDTVEVEVEGIGVLSNPVVVE
jgi:2-keto-4-pentenoate hydratase/2-oxohepta-3-ene-1,7-dioic acid hydratase in catechol pathway